jgi:magnesium chelatase accessory protein
VTARDASIGPAAWHEGGAEAAARPAGLPPVPQDWPHRDCSRSVEAAGIRWHVQRKGAGPRLLLVHGTAASTHTWRGTWPLLARSFDVLAVDLPGHGYTASVARDAMGLAAVADALAELLRVLRFAPEFVVGHSAGAAILLQMTLDGAVAPRSIVGLNAALKPFGGALNRLVRPLARWVADSRLLPYVLARRAQDPAAVRRVLENTGSALDEAGVGFYQRLLQRPQHVGAVLAMMAGWDLAPLLVRLPRLDCRLYLIAATGDLAVRPREAWEIARRIPGTEVLEIEGSGHLAHEERPEQVADLIRVCCLGSSATGD